ncbi:hypothetical protein [uncultured Comamonas sp.]|uniref:hypothetical protein n=1 Tax=uncultured Comamonas sp. TaxID=114710 RepID=UPI0025EED5DA|nr:hypothetical protein [uncultured Comamonas sp.]
MQQAFAGRGFDNPPAVRDLRPACLRGLAWLGGGCGRRCEGLDVLYVMDFLDSPLFRLE